MADPTHSAACNHSSIMIVQETPVFDLAIQHHPTLPQILRRYRDVSPTSESSGPTPLELVQYLLDEAAEKGAERLEAHFREEGGGTNLPQS